VLAALTAGPLSAQTVVPSPTRPRADSGRAGADTTRATPSDTTRRTTPSDTTRRATPSDTTRAVDSTARGAGDSVRVPAPAAPTAPATAAGPSPSPAPMDSVLAAACADGGGLAANLLVIVFAPTAADSDRVALAKAVGGRLAGPADAVRAGGYYLQVPNADLDPTVADRVIRYPTVQEVGPVSCPSP
jgi:hypothetical protein